MSYNIIREAAAHRNKNNSLKTSVSTKPAIKESLIEVMLLFSSGSKCKIKLNNRERIVAQINRECIKLRKPVEQLYILYKGMKLTFFDSVNSLFIKNGDVFDVYLRDVSKIDSEWLAYCKKNKYMVENATVLGPNILAWNGRGKLLIT